MEDGYLVVGKYCRKWILFGHPKVVLALQGTALDINTNVEAGLKIMNGLS